MSSTRNLKPAKAKRGERHSAAWGKHLSWVLLVITGMSFGQRWTNVNASEPGTSSSSRIAPELLHRLAKAQQGSAQNQTVRVIVQYRQVPTAAHYSTMQSRGGRLHARLHMIKGAAFTIPVSALPALETDPEIASVTIDHPLKGMDDYTDAAMKVSEASSLGYDGTGIGVAVIDSGINDTHSDLWTATGHNSRVVYHHDFTGTAPTQSGSSKQVWDLYGHGTHVAGNFGRISVNGSNGYGTVAAPGNDPLVLTVGALKSMGTYSRTDDQIASYSSKGPTTYDHVVKPDLVAPGNLVVSLDAPGSTLEAEYPGNEVAGNASGHD